MREWLRESKQAPQKNQSGERDNPWLFIYSSYFQGTSQEVFFALNIWWRSWPWFTVLTLYLQGPRVQGCVTALQRTSFFFPRLPSTDRCSLMWKQCPEKSPRLSINIKRSHWYTHTHTHQSVLRRWREEGEAGSDREPPKRFEMGPSQESRVYTFMNLLPLPSIIEWGGSQGPSPFTASMCFFFFPALQSTFVESGGKKMQSEPCNPDKLGNSCGSVGAPPQSCF